MTALRLAEKRIMDEAILLHWIAGEREKSDPAVAHHLRVVADKLNDAAMELRELWQSDWAPLI